MGMGRITELLRQIALVAVMASPVAAEEVPRTFGMSFDEGLSASGLLDYILPRFALKTGRRFDPEMAADLSLAAGQGAPFAQRGDVAYGVDLLTDSDAAMRFRDWLLSEVGQNTISTFAPETGDPYGPVVIEEVVEEDYFEGDIPAGRLVAETHCTRCHKVSPEDRSSIGSTPSFMAMRALPDWAARFVSFYSLNPHPAFLQVDGISAPFDVSRPPTIAPVLLTLDEVDNLLAYVQSVAPADLGAEIQHQ